MVKQYLASKGLTYDEANLEEHPDQQAKVFEMSGALTVPVTIVTKQDDTKDVVIGYNLSRLAPAIA